MTSPKDSKWDRRKTSRRSPISEHDKELMANYLWTGLEIGKCRDELLEELAEKYGRSPRQIERHIARFSRNREILTAKPANESRKLVALVQRLRDEVASYSPVKLLQEWLDKAHEDAITGFYSNKSAENLYAKALERHREILQAKPLFQAENDPAFQLLRQRVPTSDIWATLNVWHSRIAPYIQSFYGMLKKVECVTVNAMNSSIAGIVNEGVKDIDWIDCANFQGYEKRYKLERLLTVFVICDLLVYGIAIRPSNVYWAHMIDDLKRLRLRMNAELSAVTSIPAKGGWVSGVMETWEKSPDRPLELTQAFLDELAELQSTGDSLVKALGRLENEI